MRKANNYLFLHPHHRSSTETRARRKRHRADVEALEPRTLLSIGGGSTAAGFLGEYFDNPDLSGSPAFTRGDVRIDFDWDGRLGPGGSRSSDFAALDPTGFSVRWTGQVVPRFSEPYTFTTTTAGGVRLSVKPAGSSTWTVLVDDWSAHQTITVDAGSLALASGQAYDLCMEYTASAAEPAAGLAWSSASTPAATIDPLSTSGYNFGAFGMLTPTYADAFRQGRDVWAPIDGASSVPTDADGWPLSDASNVVWEGKDDTQFMAGTYHFQFQGKAEVTAYTAGSFIVGGRNYGNKLPSGVGYDPATNTTAAAYINPGSAFLALYFRQTQRDTFSPLKTGVSQVHLWRPVQPGATATYSADTLFTETVKDTVDRFTVLRYITSVDKNTEVDWSDRTLPTFFKSVKGFGSMSWEDIVMFANEIGKDAYLQIPMGATDDYITRLAKLLRYGSDGVDPYDSPRDNPAYPPLNPNLRVYLEWSNEVWNWGYTQAGQGVQLAKDAIAQGTRDGQIINYDGHGNYQRWTAVRMVQTSKIFRSVWGDDAMGPTIRPLLEYQYDNEQDTAGGMLTFIDNYFNNVDGQHVADPHPVSYHIWGAGGASYYGSGNTQGYQDAIRAQDQGFEGRVVAAGDLIPNPAGSTWNFSGDAGLLRDATLQPAADGVALGTPTTSLAQASMLGFSFTVGDKDIGVYELGRWVASANSRAHVLRLIRASDKAQVASITVNMADGQVGTFLYGKLPNPVVLKAGQTYYLLSEEANGRDRFYLEDTAVTPTPGAGIAINGAICAITDTQSDTNKWNYSQVNSGNRSFGPVDLKFADHQVAGLGFVPAAPEGEQVAYIGSSGTLSTTINFDTPGVYALDLFAASMDGKLNAIDIYVDGQKVTPQTYRQSELKYYRPSNTPWSAGCNWGQNYRNYAAYGSAPFEITTAGTHTISFVGRGDGRGDLTPGRYLFVDQVRVTSLDAFFQAEIPKSWSARFPDYPSHLDSIAKYAEAYGLNVVSYEGGWGVGGERGMTPLNLYAKYVDARAKQASLDALQAFMRSGGDLYVWGTFELWANIWDTASFPLVEAIDESNDELPLPADNGTPVSTTPGAVQPLGTAELTWSADGYRNGVRTNLFGSWNIIVPRTGRYTITASGGGRGGIAALVVDGTIELARGASDSTLSGTVDFTEGLHTIMIEKLSGSFSFPRIELERVPDPGMLAVSLSLAGSPMAEAAGQATITATLLHASEEDVVVHLGFAGTATPGADYRNPAASITIPAGTLSASISLTAIQDTLEEGNETMIVSILDASNATPFGGPVTAIIADDDATSQVVDDGGPCFVAVGEWSPSTLGGFQGDSLYSAAGTGADRATWTFSVTPGRTYRVMATWPAHGNRASNAPFTVLDGSTALATVAVNQRVAPSDVTAAGASWKLLGSYAISGGQLAVRLSDAANGIVGADAIRIEEVRSISGRMFIDRAGDGVADGNDPDLAGWTIDVTDSRGMVVASAVTTDDGSYVISGLAPGGYTVRPVARAGWVPTSPLDGSTQITISDGGAGDIDFGCFRTVSFSGNVFNDVAGDGARDAMDPGLGSWTVDLSDATGQIVVTTTTATNGTFTFQGLGPGAYVVSIANQAGWIQTLPSASPWQYTVQTSSGSNVESIDFGNFEQGKVSGLAFEDINGNGTRDAGEPELPGRTVSLLDAGGGVVATATTDALGHFAIANLGAGTYTLQQTVPSGWAATQPGNSGYSVTITSGANLTDRSFGSFTIRLFGTIFDDRNGDGTAGSVEPGLEGWVIDACDSRGTVVASAVTGDGGTYSINGLIPGTYTICPAARPGWVTTFPSSGSFQVTVSSGDLTGLEFGCFQTVSISGTVFDDLAGDGARQPADAGLAGWTVELSTESGVRVRSTTTAADGSYAFPQVGPGSYVVSEVRGVGWSQTAPRGASSYTFPVSSGCNVPEMNFGNFQKVSVVGQVYEDVNGNAARDQGEPALPGRTVMLLDPAGNVLATTTADPVGNYAFAGLGPGIYTVRQVIPAGWAATQPAGADYTVTPTSGGNLADKSFGSFKLIVDDGGASFGTVGAWSPSTLGGFQGDSLYSAAGTGADRATWTFSVTPGQIYRVMATWTNHPNRATNAPFTVLDGSTALATVAVNQRLAPNDVTADAASWKVLGSYAIASGHLVVKLSDAANGNVIADAIRIEEVSPPPVQIIDDGDSGYGTVGPWAASSLGGYQGDSFTNTAGSGADAATWTFTVTPGQAYRVSATWTNHSNRATNAPYTILDGGTALSTVRVNQKLAPDNFSDAGRSWEDLGLFTASGATLVVRVTDAADGAVVADAIRIEEVTVPLLQQASSPSGAEKAMPIGSPSSVALSSLAGSSSSTERLRLDALSARLGKLTRREFMPPAKQVTTLHARGSLLMGHAKRLQWRLQKTKASQHD